MHVAKELYVTALWHTNNNDRKIVFNSKYKRYLYKIIPQQQTKKMMYSIFICVQIKRGILRLKKSAMSTSRYHNLVQKPVNLAACSFHKRIKKTPN